MTPAEVSAELERRGYDVPERVLTEWRSNGLMPSLTDHGRGRGAGKAYTWDAPEIIGRATLVHDLLALHNLVEPALLTIWYDGYSVDLHKLRTAVRDRLDVHRADVQRRFNRHNNPEDAVAAFAERYARKVARRFGFKLEEIGEGVTEFAALIFEAKSSWDLYEQQAAEDAAAAFFAKQGSELLRPIIASLDLNGIVGFLKNTIFPKATRELFDNSSDDELVKARDRWCRIRQIAEITGALYLKPEASTKIPPLQKYSLMYGRLMVPMLIYLDRIDTNSAIDQSLEKVEKIRFLSDLSSICTKILRQENVEEDKVAELSQVLTEMANLWGYPELAAVFI